MLAGEFSTIALDEIIVRRDNRVRKVLTEESIAELADSIARLGLIHPIVLDRNNELVAGETRLNACSSLGWTHIPFQYADTLDEHTLLAIELEENIKRKDIDWKDRCSATLKYHELQKESNPGWVVKDTAKAIGLTEQRVGNLIAVGREVLAGNQRVLAAPVMSTAQNIVKRINSRREADELAAINEVEAVPKTSSILVADFNEFARTYTGQPFNFLHCDFPYGINAGDGTKYSDLHGDEHVRYSDTFEDYSKLINTLCACRNDLLGTSGHIIFWFSMNHYQFTLETLRQHFWVEPHPLIWLKSDNAGVVPDPTRGPRRIYETAFLCSHGDRKIISPTSNAFSAPRGGESVHHTSVKNQSMLEFFFKMIVDGNTRMLDPTCGSGSALRAAKALGAPSILGLEINEEFAENARRGLGE